MKIVSENGKVIETSKITKQLKGYTLEHQSKALSMKGMLNFLSAKDIFNNQIMKVCLPDSININGCEKLSSMTKRVLKLLKYV